MGKAFLRFGDVEGMLLTIFAGTPNESFTSAQLEAMLEQASSQEAAPGAVREVLWDLYHRGHAEPLQPTSDTLEQRWKLAERQRDQLKNRQSMWKTTPNN